MYFAKCIPHLALLDLAIPRGGSHAINDGDCCQTLWAKSGLSKGDKLQLATITPAFLKSVFRIRRPPQLLVRLEADMVFRILVWTDRLTQLVKASFSTWLTNRLDAAWCFEEGLDQTGTWSNMVYRQCSYGHGPQFGTLPEMNVRSQFQ